MSKALALLSTHPLTSERRAALEGLAVTDASLSPAFTDEEWRAIKAMCGPPANAAAAPAAADPANAAPRKGEKNS